MNVGFLGLGIMGRPMASNLLRAGIPLTVWNRTSPAVDALVAEGATPADTVHELFERSDVVLMMLANERAIDAVLGPDAATVGDTTLANMGTVSPGYSERLGAMVAAAGGVFIEAPVSGSRRPAEQGMLVGMLAGDEGRIAELEPILAPLCTSTTYCGPVPGALTMKLAVNVFLISVVTGLAEAFHFADRHGIDRELLRGVLDAGQMSSPISRVKTQKLAAGDLSPQASIVDVLANSVLITDAARAAGISSPLLDVCRELYAEAVALGDGAIDMVGVINAIEGRTAASS